MDFLNSITSDEMRLALEEIATGRADVRTALYIVPTEKRAEWLHSIGAGCEGRLRSLLPAIPPLALRSIVAAPEEEVFLWTGAVDVTYLIGLYEIHGDTSLPYPRRVLDFGCGCGRLTRYLGLSQRYSTIGADVNPDHIAWCFDHLPNVISVCNSTRPPLALLDGSIDFAYSLSVFSHLPEHAARAWLDDLARVITPGGILVITTHGPTALDIIKASKAHQEMFCLNATSTQAIIDRLRTERLIFVPYESAVLEAAKVGDDYGNTFIAPDKAEPLWSDLFETITFQAGGLRGWQDAFVLRRRKS
ncbi:MAG: hypothetical protein QOD40_1919 [Alphaproteobacteria bacterium]|jgi:SAM-dependent methyltransferase|nr:hypothetical protein [Alphaproteobacteria bacterium]